MAFNTLIKTTAAAASVALMGTAASALSVSYSDTVAVSATDFAAAASVSQFDSSLGTLTSVTVLLEGIVAGSARGENVGTAANFILKLAAEVSASLGGINLVTVLPTVSNTFAATGFDGVFDWGGTSGVTYDNLGNTDTDSETLTSAGAMAPFIGLGTISLDIAANGQSSGSGGGNLATQFATSAGATLTVTYEYDEPMTPVPLPATGLLLLGALGLTAAKRRKS